MFEITKEEITRLTATQLQNLLLRLLHLEIKDYSDIPASSIKVSLKENTSDGGDDGTIAWVGSVDRTDFLPSRNVLFQCKATYRSGGMTPSACADEIGPEDISKPDSSRKLDKGKKKKEILIRKMKSEVEKVLDADDGQYILFCTEDFGPTMITKRNEAMKNAIKCCGKNYSNPKVEIYDANRIRDWVNKYISAITFVQNCLGNTLPLALKTLQEWAEFPQFTQFTFVESEETKEKIDQITNSLAEGKILRIIGSSGLGKTRLVLEAFKRQAKNSFACAYINASEAVNIIATINDWRRRKVKGVLIIDDCDGELHDRVKQEIVRSTMKLVTIGHDRDKSNGDSIIELCPLSTEDIIKIIKQSSNPEFKKMSDQDVEKIAELAEGYPKLVELIADAYLTTSDLRSLRKSRLLEKILWGNVLYNEKGYKIICGYALFSEVGVKDKFSGQFQFISEKICNVEKYEGYRLAKRFFSERGIFSEYGRFVKISPEPLAIKLAAEWWHESHPDEIIEIFNEMVKFGNRDLLKSFFSRAAQLDFEPAVRGFILNINVKEFLKRLLTEADSEIIDHILKCLICINPIQVYIAIKEFITNPNNHKIEFYAFRVHLFTGVVEELSKIKDTFQEAVELLFELSLKEEKQISGRAKNWFLSLFKIFSQVEISPVERLKPLDKLISSYKENKRGNEVLVDTLVGALLQHNNSTITFGKSMASSRPRAPWQPQIILAEEERGKKRLQ